jgi:hypothetical protein
MEIKFGSEIIRSYKRLSYTPWYALAEFIDNSTESYIKNKVDLDDSFAKKGKTLDIKIDYNKVDGIITIEDNSIGMSESELNDALTIGKEPFYKGGRSRYGLGMKTAACWLGNTWSIRTKKLFENVEHVVTLDVEKIAKDQTNLEYIQNRDIDPTSHYTIITITDLNRSLAGRTKNKVKDYLRSMYRSDFDKLNLKLYYDGDLLDWDYNSMILNKIHKNKIGELKRKVLDFKIGEGLFEKRVEGWVGVFEDGSRRDAGFSILQNGRVIKGWPDAYRPETLFGEGGRNDLVNQRLVGELNLDEFAVSHTKDEIIFVNNEQEELEAALFENCLDFKNFALEYRKYLNDERIMAVSESTRALNEFDIEINSKELHNKIKLEVVPDNTLLTKSKLNIIDTVMKRIPASLKAKIDNLEILIFLDNQLSVNDPYVLIESTQNVNKIIIIINQVHPHWLYLKSSDSILNFIRHCTYDGIAEWKANFRLGRMDPDTIKFIKDGLLRVPLEMENHEI